MLNYLDFPTLSVVPDAVEPCWPAGKDMKGILVVFALLLAENILDEGCL